VLQLASLRTPAYVVAVEGTPAGAALRPVFLGRGDRFASARWPRPLLPLGGIGIAPGALVFSLTGEFIGAVVVENGAAAIAGARDVLDSVERLASARPSAPASLSIAVQPLTRALAAALAVKSGVVVADVDPKGPAAGLLQAADVITSVDGWAADSPDGLLLRIAARAAGDRAVIQLVRNGSPLGVTATLAAPAVESPPASTFTFVPERGGGSRVTAAPRGSGLQPGDVVTRAATVDAPTPLQMRRLLAGPTPTGLVVLVVRRDSRQHIVPVAVAPATDASR
jgi:S1-C subfamily serine protease